MLHTVNKSPHQSSCLSSCLRLAQPGDAILLIEDGVYAAMRGQYDMLDQSIKFYVLEPDAQARGIQQQLANGVERVDYEGFVQLTAQHGTVQSWF